MLGFTVEENETLYANWLRIVHVVFENKKQKIARSKYHKVVYESRTWLEAAFEWKPHFLQT